MQGRDGIAPACAKRAWIRTASNATLSQVIRCIISLTSYI